MSHSQFRRVISVIACALVVPVLAACGGADERDTDRTSLAALAKHDVMWYDTMAVLKEVQATEGPVDGAQVYAVCAACHQQNGQGMAGSWPPLVGSEWLLNNPEVPIRIVLHGLEGPITVKGQAYDNIMQAWADQLSDEQIAAVLTYTRSSWGNNAPAVTAEQVAAVREATQDQAGHYTADQLESMINQ